MTLRYRCPVCKGEHRYHPRPRADQRGYTSKRWRALRALVLGVNPLCSGSLLAADGSILVASVDRERHWSLCESVGRISAASDLDHETVLSGPDDRTFYVGPFNALCADCHKAKTNVERVGWK